MHEIMKVYYDNCGFTTQKVVKSNILVGIFPYGEIHHCKQYLELIPYYIMYS
jgi:hypothetical protein